MGTEQLTELLQQPGACDFVILRTPHPNKRPEITQTSGAEHRIHNRMADDITIGVALTAITIRVQDPSYPTLLACLNLMRIKRAAHAEIVHSLQP